MTAMKKTEIQLNDNGDPLKDSSGQAIPVTPLYATGVDAYRGRLVTQGNLLVNGRVITETVENQFAPGTYITGELHCYASDAASELSNNLAPTDDQFVDTVSWSAESNAVIESDVEKLWSGNE